MFFFEDDGNPYNPCLMSVATWWIRQRPPWRIWLMGTSDIQHSGDPPDENDNNHPTVKGQPTPSSLLHCVWKFHQKVMKNIAGQFRPTSQYRTVFLAFRLDIALIHCLTSRKSHKLENGEICSTFTFFGHPNTVVGLLWLVNEQYLPPGSNETAG